MEGTPIDSLIGTRVDVRPPDLQTSPIFNSSTSSSRRHRTAHLATRRAARAVSAS
jgi:hypothetical protein